jgi:hypothetical protein
VVRGCLGFAFSVAFRAACVFSFAANSCLTLRLMASASTLYAAVASRSTCAAFCLVAAFYKRGCQEKHPSSSARRGYFSDIQPPSADARILAEARLGRTDFAGDCGIMN